MSGYFGRYFGAYFDAQAAAAVEQPSGGYAWRGWYTFGEYLRRKYPERKKVERAIEQEIAALMEPERPPVKAPEEVGREYLAELRQAIAEAQKADEQFRRFIEQLQLADTERLENLLRLEAALRREIARRRDEEEAFLLHLIAA